MSHTSREPREAVSQVAQQEKVAEELRTRAGYWAEEEVWPRAVALAGALASKVAEELRTRAGYWAEEEVWPRAVALAGALASIREEPGSSLEMVGTASPAQAGAVPAAALPAVAAA